jgi:hypothetical protein
MHYKSSFLHRIAVLALAIPVVGFSAVTGINVATSNLAAPVPFSIPSGSTATACGYGSCTSAALAAGALTSGGSTTGPYSFNVTAADGDIYNIAGTFSNAFLGGTTLLGFFPTVTYTGNSIHGAIDAVAQDTITIDMLQDFTFPGSGISWAGTYNETLPLNLPVAGSQASGQVLYSTVTGTGTTVDAGGTVGELGPVFGTGMYNLTGTHNISPLDGNYLASDFQFTFVFPGGTATPVGGFISSPVSLTPEPAQTIPAAMGLVGLFLFKARKFRFGTAK